jgi:hypothetical protein
LGSEQLATDGWLALPFKPQAIVRASVMTKRKRDLSLVRRDEQPENALWRNVVAQAIQDATMPLTDHQGQFRDQMEIIRGQARRWVKMQTDDFQRVCELAGLEASRVHTFAMTRIREAIARDQARTLAILKGSTPGVVAEIADGQGDRRPPAPQKTEKIEFSQNQGSAS